MIYYVTASAYILMFYWFVRSIRLIRKARKDHKATNNHFLHSLPSGFTTIGILGTFLGILVGLFNFDVQNIDGSIPTLLIGLKTAFSTSVIGLFLSFIFNRHVDKIQHKIDTESGREDTEIGALNSLIQETKKQTSENKKTFKGFDENLNIVVQQLEMSAKSQEKSAMLIVEKLENGNKILSSEFEKFGKLLGDINTEAMVKAIENALGGFNERFNELIERLVKENFDQLNDSVSQLNEWQIENKEQINQLVTEYKNVSKNLEVSAQTLDKAAKATNELTKNDSVLIDLVKQLEKVLIDENKLVDITTRTEETVENLFETGQMINDYLKKEEQVKESLSTLIKTLNDFKDFNSDVWKNYRTEMEQSVKTIKSASTSISENIEEIDEKFYERLNTTLGNLDACIQSFADNNRLN